MTSLTLCKCTLAMHLDPITNTYKCEHCDEPCELSPGRCAFCKIYARSVF